MDITQQAWLNSNGYRAYPLRETVSRYAVLDGSVRPDVQIPNSIIVDLILSLAGAAAVRVYVSKVALIGGFLSLEFKDADGVTVCTTAINTADHTRYDAYPLVGVGTYEDARGSIVIGDTTQLHTAFPEGNFDFSLATAELEPSVIRPDIRGVRSIQVDNNGEVSARLTGHVRLVAGQNIRLVPLPEQNAIRIDAIDANRFADACECEDTFQLPCITSVNGISIANLQIVGSDCVVVERVDNKIKITDKCATPCCGCVELELLSKALDTQADQMTRVINYSDNLRDKLEQFINNVLASL